MGSYSKKNGLSVTKENFQFYTETGLAYKQLEARCTDELCSAGCAKVAEVVVTAAPEVKTDSDFRVADMVILVVVLVVCLLLVCGMIVGFSYFRRKVRGETDGWMDG